MKILVTGGLGFIGSHLVDRLVSDGNEVVVLDNNSTGSLLNANDKAISIWGNINDHHLLEELFSFHKFECVYHLAAQINLRKSILDPLMDAETNILGGLAVIKKCIDHKVKKIIFSSTGGAIYSERAPQPFWELSLPQPSSPYGLSKLTLESYLKLMKDLKGLDYVALRYSNVYGPRQNPHGEAGVISIFKDRALKGLDLTINGNGEQTRDFVYVADVVEANILAQNLSGIYNVSSNTETTVNDIALKILSLTKSQSKINHAPAIGGEMIRCRLSSDKIKGETGWQTSCSFDIGLERTINE
jgi:UDP-glucose 4-epimerase